MHGLCVNNYWLVLIGRAFQCDTGSAVAPRLARSCVTCKYVPLSLLHIFCCQPSCKPAVLRLCQATALLNLGLHIRRRCCLSPVQAHFNHAMIGCFLLTVCSGFCCWSRLLLLLLLVKVAAASAASQFAAGGGRWCCCCCCACWHCASQIISSAVAVLTCSHDTTHPLTGAADDSLLHSFCTRHMLNKQGIASEG